MVWYQTSVIFLRILKILSPSEAEERKEGDPAWLDCCNASCLGQRGGGLQFPNKTFMLPPFTPGLMAAHRSCQPHSIIPWTFSGKRLWQMFFFLIMLTCQRISVEMGGCSITLIFWAELEAVQRDEQRGSLHNTLETKCLVLSLTLQSCLCLSQRFWFFVWKAWLNVKKTELVCVYTRFETVNDWIYHLSNIWVSRGISRFHLCKCDQFEHLKLQINKLGLVLWIKMFLP